MSTNADQEVLVGIAGDGTAVRGLKVFTVTSVLVVEIEIEELTTSNPQTPTGASAVHLQVLSDQPIYLSAGRLGVLPDPDPAARFGDPNEDDMCGIVPAFFPWTRKFTKDRATAIKLIAINLDARVQVERVSPIIGGSNVGA